MDSPSVGEVWKFVRLGLLFPALAYLAFQVRWNRFSILFSAKGCVIEDKRVWKKYIWRFLEGRAIRKRLMLYFLKPLPEYAVISSPQYTENKAFLSSFPIDGIHSSRVVN